MKRLALGIAAAVVLTTPSVVVAAEPGTAARAPIVSSVSARPAVTLSAPTSALTGSRVSFAGRVTNGARGTKVKVQRRVGQTWRTLATATTDSGGRFSASVILSGPGRAAYRASTTRGSSATTYVAILRRISVQVRANRTNAETGRPLTLSVTTTPSQAGGPIQLQTRTGSSPWQGAGTSALTTGGRGTLRPQPATTGQVQYRVLKPRHGYAASAVSAAIAVAVQPKNATFGQLMDPSSTQVVDPAVATWTFHSQPPSWSETSEIRWDTPGAFTPSLTPAPSGTYESAVTHLTPNPDNGAEFNNGNASLQTADVSFRATGTSFAIRYLTYATGTAMVWIDGHPVSANPIPGVAPFNSGQLNWIQVTLPQPRTVHVRFAGPTHFIGVDHDANVPLTVTAAPYPFTLGVVSDSYFDGSLPYRTYEGSGAAVLNTRTGFRIWSHAQGGTGYLNDATGAGWPGHYVSPFGSAARMARLKDAPIDAVLVNGSINDANYDNTAYAAAVNNFLDDVARIRPGLPVVVVGLQPVTVVAAESPAYRADLDAKNQLLKQIAAAHANVVGFINPYDEDWLTGTGSTASPQGDGNQDLYVGPDHIHLSPAGQAYYQDLIADRLAPLRATLQAP